MIRRLLRLEPRNPYKVPHRFTTKAMPVAWEQYCIDWRAWMKVAQKRRERSRRMWAMFNRVARHFTGGKSWHPDSKRWQRVVPLDEVRP